MKVADLIKLGQKSLELFNEDVIKMNVKPPIRVYVQHFTTELEISETGCRSTGSSKIVQKPDWSKIVFDFIEEKIKTMPEFKYLNQSIAKRYKKNINEIAEGCDEISQSSFWLTTFIQRLIYEKLEDTFSDDLLIEYASLFKSELELSPLEYKYINYLDGIFLEPKSVRINDNVLIRKTQKSDLEYIRDIFLDTPRPQYMGLPSSILELVTYTKDERDCYEQLNRIFTSLRLYNLASIHSKESISTKRTIIWPGGPNRGWQNRPFSTFRNYTVKKTEVASFINFVNIIEQKLNFDKEDKKYRTLHISIDRYNSALLESIEIERKLMTAVMGLESLFTFEKDRGENAFKLGIRIARLLGHFNFDVENVRSITEEAYQYRNKVVHGSYISQELKKRMNEIFPHILNYLRISLITFLLNQKIGKDKIVEMIDKSMISNIHNEELKKLLEKNIKEFSNILTENI